MNATFNGYAVFFFPQALEALGNAIAPYLQDSPAGPHVLCREIDTGGSLIELTMDGKTSDGQPIDLELMLPTNMIRMIVSARSDQVFGFGPRTAVAPLGGEAPVLEDGPGPAHAPAEKEPEPTPMARRGHPSPAGRAAHKASDARRRPAKPRKAAKQGATKAVAKAPRKAAKSAAPAAKAGAAKKKR
jgi:hypothetical protein